MLLEAQRPPCPCPVEDVSAEAGFLFQPDSPGQAPRSGRALQQWLSSEPRLSHAEKTGHPAQGPEAFPRCRPLRLRARGAMHRTPNISSSILKASYGHGHPARRSAWVSLQGQAEGPEETTSLPLLPVANQWSLRGCPGEVALPEPCFGQLSVPRGQTVGSPVAWARP